MGQNIIAIDDSPTLRKFIVKSLSDHSTQYNVTTAPDAEQGLEQAKRETPDLILLDFHLPGMTGGDLCAKLNEDPVLASVPIVMMSSSVSDIKFLEKEYESVKRSIAKPFTPELLCATVSFVLRERKDKPAPVHPESAGQVSFGPAEKVEPIRVPSQPIKPPPRTEGVDLMPSLVFSGSVSYFRLIDGLRALEQDRITGVLKLYLSDYSIDVYFDKGSPVLITTRDVDRYLRDAQMQIAPEQQGYFEEIKGIQKTSGCPIFMSLAERNLMEHTEALNMAYAYGCNVFRDFWTDSRARFEFHKADALPDFATGITSAPDNVDEWAMDSLRQVGEECLSAIAWGDPNGLPAYTRAGYENIQHIALHEEEVELASLIGEGGRNLETIAASMGRSVEEVQQILFRFMCLNIFDYWPDLKAGQTTG